MAIFKIMCLEAQGSDTFYGVDTMIASRQAKISSGLEFNRILWVHWTKNRSPLLGNVRGRLTPWKLIHNRVFQKSGITQPENWNTEKLWMSFPRFTLVVMKSSKTENMKRFTKVIHEKMKINNIFNDSNPNTMFRWASIIAANFQIGTVSPIKYWVSAFKECKALRFGSICENLEFS